MNTEQRFKASRQPKDVEAINHFVNAFLRPEEKKLVADFLGTKTNPEDLKFDDEEALRLASGHDHKVLMGVESQAPAAGAPQQENTLLPILQLYDFINTVDRVITKMRSLEVQIQNMSVLSNAKSVEEIKKQVLHPTYVPWPTLEALQGRSPSDMKEVIAAHPGIVLGSSHQLWVKNTAGAAPIIPLAGLPGAAQHDPPALVTLPPDPAQLAHVNQNMEVVIKPKFNYDRCCEEAYLLNVEVMNYLIGLGQGLFRVQDTRAKAFAAITTAVPAANVDNPVSADDIPMGSWINAFEHTNIPADLRDVVVPIYDARRDGPGAPGPLLAALQGGWIGPTTVFYPPAGVALGVALPITSPERFLLQAKDTNLAHYPRNLMGKLARMIGVSPTDAQQHFAWPTAVGMVPNAVNRADSVRPTIGGPIAQWFWTMHSTRTGALPPVGGGVLIVGVGVLPPAAPGAAAVPRTVCWPSATAHGAIGQVTIAGVGGPSPEYTMTEVIGSDEDLNAHYLQPHDHNVLEDSNPGGAVGDNTYNSRAPRAAFHVEVARIHEIMSSYRRHPIWACPRLADAYRRSRLGATLIHMYFKLQVLLSDTLKTDVVLRGTDDARLIPHIASLGSGVVPTDKCPAGMAPKYKDYDGRVVDPTEATYSSGGITYLKSNIDPTKTECIVITKAPSAGGPTPPAHVTKPQISVLANVPDGSILAKIKEAGGLTIETPTTAAAAAASTATRRRVTVRAPAAARTTQRSKSQKRSKSAPPPSSTERTDRRRYKCVIKTTSTGHKQRYWVRK